jgi:Spy/CpxP family protein refolding chaperone
VKNAIVIMRASLALLAGTMIVIGMAAAPRAQRGGGGGGGMPRGEFGGFPLTRLEILTNDFQLNKDQKKAVKALLDEAHKGAATTREALVSAHAAIGTAIAANKGPAEIDAAVKQYGQQAAAMATLEMKTFGQLVQQLEIPQRGNEAAVRSAFILMRGIFLDPKKWDKVLDFQGY